MRILSTDGWLRSAGRQVLCLLTGGHEWEFVWGALDGRVCPWCRRFELTGLAFSPDAQLWLRMKAEKPAYCAAVERGDWREASKLLEAEMMAEVLARWPA